MRTFLRLQALRYPSATWPTIQHFSICLYHTFVYLYIDHKYHFPPLEMRETTFNWFTLSFSIFFSFYFSSLQFVYLFVFLFFSSVLIWISFENIYDISNSKVTLNAVMHWFWFYYIFFIFLFIHSYTVNSCFPVARNDFSVFLKIYAFFGFFYVSSRQMFLFFFCGHLFKEYFGSGIHVQYEKQPGEIFLKAFFVAQGVNWKVIFFFSFWIPYFFRFQLYTTFPQHYTEVKHVSCMFLANISSSYMFFTL